MAGEPDKRGKGKYRDERFESIGTAILECKVSDAIAAFDNPAVYKVEDVNILEGQNVPITEVATFTHTYSGQAKEGEAARLFFVRLGRRWYCQVPLSLHGEDWVDQIF